MSENLKNTQESQNSDIIDTSTIFDEFSTDSNLLSEVEKLKEEERRDVYYYLKKYQKILKLLLILLIIFTTIGFLYNSIQKNPNFANKGYLSPICEVFNGKEIAESNNGGCSSISYNYEKYKKDTEELKLKQAADIFSIIEIVYKKENFLQTKEVLFLLSKSKNKLSVLEILNRFDSLKNEFLGLDKMKIQCKNINIDGKTKIMTMSCESYSQGFEEGILGFDGKNRDLYGTSMTIANSFLNYIDKQSNDFDIIERQKIFKKEGITGELTGYTSKTPFDLKLRINF